MDITLQLSESNGLNAQHVQRYGDGGFFISGKQYNGSVCIIGEETVAWNIDKAEDITLESLQTFIEQNEKIEILLVGCGKLTAFIHPDIKSELKHHNIVIDAMDSGAACRTYNILMSEGRRVAAALIAV